jgi:hypothetical protein
MPSRRLTFPAPRSATLADAHRTETLTVQVLQVPSGPGTKDFPDLVPMPKEVQRTLWSECPYDRDAVRRTLEGGGWFDFPHTRFADDATRDFAQAAQACRDLLALVPPASASLASGISPRRGAA